jgi:putative endonuclease
MHDWPPARRANDMYFVYAIKSSLTNRIYIGQSNDFKRKLNDHNKGIVRSTKQDRPWELIALQEVNNRDRERWKEKQMKKSKAIRDKWMIQYAYGSESEVSK